MTDIFFVILNSVHTDALADFTLVFVRGQHWNQVARTTRIFTPGAKSNDHQNKDTDCCKRISTHHHSKSSNMALRKKPEGKFWC